MTLTCIDCGGERKGKGDPAWQAYKTASGKRLRAQYDADPAAQERNAEQRAQVGQKISDHRLGWCPREYRPEYRRLHRIMLAADARRIIEQQIARDRKRADAALSPFQRQDARAAAGASIIPRFNHRRADHDFTLGGVATGML